MGWEQSVVICVLLGALVLFAWDYWRYDVVAVLALAVLAVFGIVPAENAFSGFGHPAVITVAAMLVLSRALENSGIAETIASRLTGIGARPVFITIVLTVTVAVLSGFMNNVGALALMLPIAFRVAARNDVSPSLVLMPLGFASILGGLSTLIGTPPNIITSSYREQAVGSPYDIFDFSPVGVAVVLGGLLVLALVSRPLIRARGSGDIADALSNLDPYITEIQIPDDSPFVDRPLREFVELGRGDCAVVSMIRGGGQTLNPRAHRIVRAGDILVIEADPETLQAIIDTPGVELVGEQKFKPEELISSEMSLAEAVVMPNSQMERNTATSLLLHLRFGVNLLAISRQGQNIAGRLGHEGFKAGDVLLLQGDAKILPETIKRLGCVPITESRFRPERPLSVVPIAIFVLALVIATLGLLEIQIALVAAAVVIVLIGHLTLQEVYDSVDWAVIVLLGAMVPVGQSLESTGITALMADGLLTVAANIGPEVLVAGLVVCAMALSNIVNNAATAILMAPIAVSMASSLKLGPDTFLMAVAIGSSCAFLTPIGHQSNLLVMGPGQYRFSDYWRLGLPLSFTVILIAVPLILVVWPLSNI